MSRRRYTPQPRKKTYPEIAELLAMINPNRETFSYNQVVLVAETMLDLMTGDDETFKERCRQLLALAWTA